MKSVSPATSAAERPPVGLFSAVVIVAALGYFVDIYDLVLFSIIRVESLKAIGVPEAAITDEGLHLLSMQMWGMLLGGVLWGVLGDKRGRLSVLFGSILLYSLANIANGFVTSVDQYAWLRLIAGVGLAGELGAGITLVAESLPKEKRGYGTMIVASVGVSGAMVAYLIGVKLFGWRNAYFIGGGLGLALLALRVSVFESGMFEQTKASDVARGDFLSLFTNGPRFSKYLRCLLLGTPFWFLVGILITLAPEFGKQFGLQAPVTGGLSIFWCYFGLTLGDFTSGALSQLLRSRTRTLQLFILATSAMVAVYLFGLRGAGETAFYAACFGIGYAGGFWALFVTVAAEQFGTNLRSTVATTIPNFARGATVVVVPCYQYLKAIPALGMVGSAATIGAVLLALAFFSASTLPETYAKDLNYVE
jgi:putative MFS transporter